jgi:cystathionine beta-lyase/cystathionine gamma-synthase
MRHILPEVAPSMGSFQDGIRAFQELEPPYGRGGGTPSTRFLKERVLQYLAQSRASSGAFNPSITITANGQAANHTLFRALWGIDMVASEHVFGTTSVDLKHTFERIGGAVSGSRLV